LHIIKRDIKGEKKYGIDTTGADELSHLEDKGIDITHATIYMPASYDLLEAAFTHLQPAGIKHMVDLGAGKGRAMCVAAHYHIPKVTGIDLSKEFCEEAIANLEHTKTIFPQLEYKIINNDAFYYDIPADADCIFLFNPFDEVIMREVIHNIDDSLKRSPRDLFVIYLNPLHKELFTKKGYRQIFHVKKMNYIEACILRIVKF